MSYLGQPQSLKLAVLEFPKLSRHFPRRVTIPSGGGQHVRKVSTQFGEFQYLPLSLTIETVNRGAPNPGQLCIINNLIPTHQQLRLPIFKHRRSWRVRGWQVRGWRM